MDRPYAAARKSGTRTCPRPEPRRLSWPHGRCGLHRGGVSLGAFDRTILAWLSGFEPETAAVIAGLITRAHQAGRI